MRTLLDRAAMGRWWVLGGYPARKDSASGGTFPIRQFSDVVGAGHVKAREASNASSRFGQFRARGETGQAGRVRGDVAQSA
jgi:hypothetical protein